MLSWQNCCRTRDCFYENSGDTAGGSYATRLLFVETVFLDQNLCIRAPKKLNARKARLQRSMTVVYRYSAFRGENMAYSLKP
jgi:hypothetical protein